MARCNLPVTGGDWDLVSGAMLQSGGIWAQPLNDLFLSLIKGRKKEPLVVVDLGANVGPFSLFVASQGYEVRYRTRRTHCCDQGLRVKARYFVYTHMDTRCDAPCMLQVYSFEMQLHVYTMLELSRRINHYSNMHLFNAALWNETGIELSYRPLHGNLGGNLT